MFDLLNHHWLLDHMCLNWIAFHDDLNKVKWSIVYQANTYNHLPRSTLPGRIPSDSDCWIRLDPHKIRPNPSRLCRILSDSDEIRVAIRLKGLLDLGSGVSTSFPYEETLIVDIINIAQAIQKRYFWDGEYLSHLDTSRWFHFKYLFSTIVFFPSVTVIRSLKGQTNCLYGSKWRVNNSYFCSSDNGLPIYKPISFLNELDVGLVTTLLFDALKCHDNDDDADNVVSDVGDDEMSWVSSVDESKFDWELTKYQISFKLMVLIHFYVISV
jgi:hypothetical protein